MEKDWFADVYGVEKNNIIQFRKVRMHRGFFNSLLGFQFNRIPILFLGFLQLAMSLERNSSIRFSDWQSPIKRFLADQNILLLILLFFIRRIRLLFSFLEIPESISLAL